MERPTPATHADPQTAPPHLPKAARLAGSFVLFFNGGCPEAPENGAAGSVLVQFDREHARPAISWVASISYRNTSMTDDEIDCRGLLSGLRRAVEKGCFPLHVVGDNHRALSWMESAAVPSRAELRRLVLACWGLAKQLRVASWTMHTRRHNRMAAAATTEALCSHQSRHHTPQHPRVELLSIYQELDNDISRWTSEQEENTRREQVLRVEHDVEEEPRAGRAQQTPAVVAQNEEVARRLLRRTVHHHRTTLLRRLERLRLLRREAVVAHDARREHAEAEQETPHDLETLLVVLTLRRVRERLHEEVAEDRRCERAHALQ
ncbi:hypothetical protein PybrP1_001451 [[Pythium] brassicae (nom. inval.)]|nr:hypothetical protein PybrP1_001451 [[Pythium] brassicae (nom. inval.)]